MYALNLEGVCIKRREIAHLILISNYVFILSYLTHKDRIIQNIEKFNTMMQVNRAQGNLLSISVFFFIKLIFWNDEQQFNSFLQKKIKTNNFYDKIFDTS